MGEISRYELPISTVTAIPTAKGRTIRFEPSRTADVRFLCDPSRRAMVIGRGLPEMIGAEKFPDQAFGGVSCLTGVLLVTIAFSWAALSVRAQSNKADLPYVTIDHPQFVSAAEATFLSPHDMLIGVSDGKTAKAYPAAILAQHGVVQDSVADGPIAVTW